MFFNPGISTIFVRKFNNIIIKKLATHNKFLRELAAYQLLSGWPHIPKLLKYNTNKNLLFIQYAGQSLNLYPISYRRQFKEEIQRICKKLYSSYGVYHNDIRWKNIIGLGDNSNNFFIIDWEVWGYVNKERDPERILNIEDKCLFQKY